MQAARGGRANTTPRDPRPSAPPWPSRVGARHSSEANSHDWLQKLLTLTSPRGACELKTRQELDANSQRRPQHRGRRDHQGTRKAPPKQVAQGVAAKGVGQKTQPGSHRPGPPHPGSSDAMLPPRQSRAASRVSAPHELAQNAPETS